MTRSIVFPLVVCALFVVSVSATRTPDEAFLILRKVIHSEYPGVLAQGTNFTVELSAVNVGRRDAYDVHIRENWGEESFTLMDGTFNRTWERVAPGEKVTLNITLNPKHAGEMNGFRGLVSYKTAEDGIPQIGFSTPMIPHTVYAAEVYSRFAESHYDKWAIFTVLLLSVTAVPFLLSKMAEWEYNALLTSTSNTKASKSQ